MTDRQIYTVSEKSLCTCKKSTEPVPVPSLKWKVFQEVPCTHLMFQQVAVSYGWTTNALKSTSSYVHTR